MTNLSEDTRESDLMELFRPFGPISRIFLAKDKNTNQSKVVAPKIICLLCVCIFQGIEFVGENECISFIYGVIVA